MSSSLTSDDLSRIFAKLDQNGDGLVSLAELNWLLERVGVHATMEELESLVQKPCLDIDEFLFFYESLSESKRNKEENEEEGEESDLAKAFKVFDLNDDGFISSDELESVLSRLGLWEEKGGRDCRTMIRAFDTNSDGLLDFEEFKCMMLLTIS
ncbi:EF-hand domain [Dillenia turbinata]|uniref:EF-hand domain n=1 Tax=Dillenia turbinata TaxID=194707 RepID=A0AAN8ZMR1_9MAGN